jgi:hypothetical protein
VDTADVMGITGWCDCKEFSMQPPDGKAREIFGK